MANVDAKGEFAAEKSAATEKLLARVRELEAKRLPICWIPNDGSSFVEGHGFRVAIVVAGDDGYRLTGTWPYTGKPGETMPWFWGPTLAEAERLAKEQNRRIGVTPEEASLVLLRSIGRGTRR